MRQTESQNAGVEDVCPRVQSEVTRTEDGKIVLFCSGDRAGGDPVDMNATISMKKPYGRLPTRHHFVGVGSAAWQTLRNAQILPIAVVRVLGMTNIAFPLSARHDLLHPQGNVAPQQQVIGVLLRN